MPVDLLFIGGALYACGIDGHLKAFLKALKKEDVKRAAVFFTSWISRHALSLIKSSLTEAGIPVAEESFYSKGRPDGRQLQEVEAFTKKLL